MLAAILIISVALNQICWAVPQLDEYHPHITPKESAPRKEGENTADYWNTQAQASLGEKLARPLNQNVAKNVIMFLGDGMSIPTVSSARAYMGAEELQLAFDQFPWVGLSKTYSVDFQVPDSAATATAYLGGVKGNTATIGVTADVTFSNCDAMNNDTNHVLSIAYHSQQVGKSTGLVTTSRVTHASPAGVYGHTANRDWECDRDVLLFLQDPAVCRDLAYQLLYSETGQNLKVALGGGRGKFIPSEVTDEEGSAGDRLDGRNLITEWLDARNPNTSQYVWNRDQLLSINPETEELLGLFESGHCRYNLDRDPILDPSLAEMTQAAINVLSKNPLGYFLFVEGARIDMAHHENHVKKSLDETAEFSKAIQAAVDLTDEADTLIVVTSDHSHTLSYSGYGARGNDVLAFGGIGGDLKVYATLSYANGPGFDTAFDADGSRHDMTLDDMTGNNYVYPSTVPLPSETHGGDDVGIFARGPWAHLFTGVNEQNVIPHAMMYASCVGNGLQACGAK